MSSLDKEEAPIGSLILSEQGILTTVDEQYLKITGFSRDDLLGLHFTKLNKLLTNAVTNVETEFGHYQSSLICKNRTKLPVDIFFFRQQLHNTITTHVFVRKACSVDSSNISDPIIEKIFDHTNEAILITDNQGIIQTVNKSFTNITGFSSNDAVGKTPAILNSGKQDKYFYKQFWRQLVTDGCWQGEIWNKRKNREIYPEWLNISSIRDNNGHIVNYICQFTDITSRKKSEAELHFLAYHDTLTSLPNRDYLFEKLEHLLSLHREQPLCFAVFFCDLDRFKIFNDSLGHEAGDELLKSVAARFDAKLRDNDIIARSGGDEFTVVIEGQKPLQNIDKICKQILALFDKPFETKYGEIKTSISIGVCQFPQDSMDVKELMSFSNVAMQSVKHSGGNNYSLFDNRKKIAIKQRLALESEIFQAIEEQQFEVWYQPQINAQTNDVYGIECLIRWIHPQHGLISPNLFIPIAEANGSIKELGYFVLKSACQQLRQWRIAGLFTGVMAVNVSMRQFERNDFLSQVKQTLSEEMIPADAIEIEVTESLFAETNHHHSPILRAIRKLGAKIAIDDFGTGYSSLQRLKNLPIDNVKIDKCFVDNIESSKEDTAIVSAIILLLKTFNISFIAEGIETKAQADKLCELGCFNHQGFLYSEPLNARDFEQWLLSFKKQCRSEKLNEGELNL